MRSMNRSDDPKVGQSILVLRETPPLLFLLLLLLTVLAVSTSQTDSIKNGFFLKTCEIIDIVELRFLYLNYVCELIKNKSNEVNVYYNHREQFTN